MAATDRLDVTHTTGYEDDGQRDGITFCGVPIYLSKGQRLRDDLLLGLDPHTIHNLSIATRAQTCDIGYARDASDLYFGELLDALAVKDYEGVFRTCQRRAAFEAREQEILQQRAGRPTVTDEHVKNNMLVPRLRSCDSSRLRYGACERIGTHIAFLPGHFGASWFCDQHADMYAESTGQPVWRYEERS